MSYVELNPDTRGGKPGIAAPDHGGRYRVDASAPRPGDQEIAPTSQTNLTTTIL